MNNQISLRIHNIKCVDETGGKWDEKFGNDEIFLAGYGVEPDLDAKFIRPFEVYAHFDDGDIKRFAPPRKVVTLDLTSDGSFPKTSFAGFLLAEKDRGDFRDKATQVYNKLVEELDKKKREAIGAGRTITAGADIGEEILKKLAEKVFEELYAWIRSKIISTANDDIFPQRHTFVTIPDANFSWGGSRTSPPFAIEFRGHDGIYLMTYDWELS